MPLIDSTQLHLLLAEAAGRFDVDALDEVDSTSSELSRRAARGAPVGTVIVADRQTAGRGRRGRAWLSAPADSLTFSLLWRFTGDPLRLSGLSLAVGVALARALESLGAQGVVLKWPNDVLLARSAEREGERGGDFAKLAGILIELSTDRRGTQAIIGIGLNLQAPAGDLPQPAAGLAQAMPAVPERHALLAALLRELLRQLTQFAVDGFAGAKTDWTARHAWQDQPVRIVDEGEAGLSGLCRGVADDGALLVETAHGCERILAGDVSLRRA